MGGVLSKMQDSFIDGIYDKSSSFKILPLIKNAKVPKEELFDIYRNNLFSFLKNALRITYPRLYKHLGHKKFTEFANDYIVKNRSITGNLDDYGENFLRNSRQALSDLAELEWLEHKSYLAPDCKSIDLEKLQKLPHESLFDVKFNLHPSVFFYNSDYNLLSKQIKLEKKKIHFLVHRLYLDVICKKISKKEYDFLLVIKDGLTLYEVYERCQFDIQNYLKKFISNGVISEFSSN